MNFSEDRNVGILYLSTKLILSGQFDMLLKKKKKRFTFLFLILLPIEKHWHSWKLKFRCISGKEILQMYFITFVSGNLLCHFFFIIFFIHWLVIWLHAVGHENLKPYTCTTGKFALYSCQVYLTIHSSFSFRLNQLHP